MGLMDFLSKPEVQSFAKGYMGARIDRWKAKAEEKQKEIERQAKLNDAIALYKAQQDDIDFRNADKKEKIAIETFNTALAEIGDETFVNEAKNRGKLKTPESYNAFKKLWFDFSGNPAIFQDADFRNDWRTSGGTVNINEDDVVNNLTSNDAALAGQKNTGDALIKTKDIPSGVSVQKIPEDEVKDGSNWVSKYMKVSAPAKPTKPEFMTDLNMIVDGAPVQRLVTVREMIAEPLRYEPYTAKDETTNKDLGMPDFRRLTESTLNLIFPGKTGYQTGVDNQGRQISTFRFFGNDQEQEAMLGYNNALVTAVTLVEGYKNAERELPEDLTINLNLLSTDANVASPMLIGNSVANLFKDVKDDLTQNFSGQIDEMQQIQTFDTFKDIISLNRKEFINTYGNDYIDIYDQAKANGLNMNPTLVAQSLADVSMGEIKTFEELVAKRDLIQEGKERTLNIQKEDDMSIVRSYPEFSTSESVKEFVDGYLTADNLETKDYEDELILGLKELAKSEYDFMLLVEEAEKYIESIDPDNFQKTPITNQENLNVDIDAQTEELIEEEEPTTKKLTVKGKEYGETEVDVDEKTDINTLITTRDNLINQIENETNNVQKKRLSSKLKTIEREIKKLQGN